MYTIYTNSKAIITVEFWGSAIEIAERETKLNPNAQVWIEDSNGKTYSSN